MRTLAGRTQLSTQEIEELIAGLQQSAALAVGAMSDSVDYAAKAVGYVEAAGQAFDGIAASVKVIFDMSSQVAVAAEQQSATTEEIANSVNCIADIAERTATSALEASARSSSLAELANRLQDQVSHFTIAGSAQATAGPDPSDSAARVG